MLFLHLFLLRSFLERAFALTFGLLSVVFMGAFIENKTPEVLRSLLTCLPCAICLGACWTLGSWRIQGGLIALAAGGLSPWRPILTLCMAALPFLAAVSMLKHIPTAKLEVTPGHVRIHGEQGETIFTWDETGAERHDPDGRLSHTQLMPAPKGKVIPTTVSPILHLTPTIALFVCLSALGLKRERAGYTMTFSAAVLAFVAGELLRALTLSIYS